MKPLTGIRVFARGAVFLAFAATALAACNLTKTGLGELGGASPEPSEPTDGPLAPATVRDAGAATRDTAATPDMAAEMAKDAAPIESKDTGAPVPDAAAPVDVVPPPADTAAAFDAKPAIVDTAPTPVDTAPTPPLKTASIITSVDPPSAGDVELRTRLGRLGFTVTIEIVRNADQARGAAIRAATQRLIVVSSRADSTLGIGQSLRTLAVPVIANEAGVFDELGLCANAAQASTVDAARLNIVAPASPLAAGLSGTVTIAGVPRVVTFGCPVEGGAAVATVLNQPNHVAIASFEANAQLRGLKAPARRVMFFAHDSVIDELTDNGWRLFDAAAKWAANVP